MFSSSSAPAPSITVAAGGAGGAGAAAPAGGASMKIMTQKDFKNAVAAEITRQENAEPDNGMEAASIDARLRALRVLEPLTLLYLKEHANENSGLSSFFKANMTWAEAVDYFLAPLKLSTIQIGGKRKNRKQTKKNRRRRSRRN